MIKARLNWERLESLGSLGRPVTNAVSYATNCCVMIYLSLRAGVWEERYSMPIVLHIVCQQVFFTGYHALPIVSFLGATVGVSVFLNMAVSPIGWQDAELNGRLLYIIAVKELGPWISAIVVVARSGTAVASELGSMKVNREIHALSSMAINPLSYVVFPRLLGGVISLFCLSIYFSAIASIGGFVVTKFVSGMDFTYLFATLVRFASVWDLSVIGLKIIANGLIIFGIASYEGLKVNQSSHEIPIAASRAVVKSITTVTCFNLVLSVVSNLRWDVL